MLAGAVASTLAGAAVIVAGNAAAVGFSAGTATDAVVSSDMRVELRCGWLVLRGC